jgi:hypothetical protein
MEIQVLTFAEAKQPEYKEKNIAGWFSNWFQGKASEGPSNKIKDLFLIIFLFTRIKLCIINCLASFIVEQIFDLYNTKSNLLSKKGKILKALSFFFCFLKKFFVSLPKNRLKILKVIKYFL